MKRLVVAAVVAAVLGALSGASGHASAPSRIVFTADRAPSVSGQIYRLDPDGTLVDLSQSPFQDTAPVVSPDGQRVAFLSDRSGALSVWEVGIDGSGLVQVGPPLVPASTWQQDYTFGSAHSLAWQPAGERLASVDGNTLFMLQAGQDPLTAFVAADNGELLLGPWSPDGKVLVVSDTNARVARAFSPDGTQLWSVPHVESPFWGSWNGVPPSWSWSRSGLLALPIGVGQHPRLRVYDENGNLRFAVHGHVSGASGWSPDGKLLAVMVGEHAEVFTAAGKRILRSRSTVSSPFCRQVVWASERRFIVGAFTPWAPKRCGAFSVAVRTGKVSRASHSWFDPPLSADRQLTPFASQKGTLIAIGVRSTTHDAVTTYAHITACGPKPSNTALTPVDSLQFADPSHSLVYTTTCPDPPTVLYSVAPDGSGLEKLASYGPGQCGTCDTPALSPDGTQIAYGNGYGGIGIQKSDGTQVQLEQPPTACTGQVGDKTPYSDTSPGWSPDGTAIVFTRTGCSPEDSGLYTVTVASGVVHNLGLAGDQAAWGQAKIAYVAPRFGPATGVWTANPDGSDPTQVDPNGRDPAWSPDGRLAYLTGSNTVVVGSTPIQLPFTDVTSLAWSPDSTRFVVTARTTSARPFDVYTLNTDGTNPIQLTQNYDTLDLAGWR